MTQANQVHDILRRHQLADGFPLVMDLERSHGPWLVDAKSGTEYLDCFTCFASWPVGYNHPLMTEAAFREELLAAALNNPTNSDLYTTLMADFVEAFATRVTPEGFPHHFWVAGGALAVENALKTSFDWKARKLGLEKVTDDGASLVALHFRQAFHGRSGYTMSLTNTDPNKVALFPKFRWPRAHNPAIVFDLDGNVANDIEAEEARAMREVEAGFDEHSGKVACVIIETMQGEGGDNHFRSEFFAKLRKICDEREALLVLDEVQTGFFGSGKPWMWQHKGFHPDVVAFGKKTQVCGLYAGPRVDEVAENVFRKPGRINSTWGGNLVDMVRCKRFIEIIERESLVENVRRRGTELKDGLRELARDRGQMTNVRGLGSLVAFTLPDAAARNRLVADLREKRVLALPSGQTSVRFRLPFVLEERDVRALVDAVAACLPAGVQA